MTAWEWIAVAFGLISVYLSTREHVTSWPTAIVNVGIFFFVFWNAKLYADAVLQLFFLSLSVYGWYEWLYGGEHRTVLHVSRATAHQWAVSIPLCVAFGLGLGWYLSRHTDSPVPYLDAMLTSGSLVAQWMMTRKLLENWALWILLDIVYVPTFISRGLAATAAQYAVFLVLAWMGHQSWRKSLAAQGAAQAARAPVPA